jgi:hypothetical protein
LQRCGALFVGLKRAETLPFPSGFRHSASPRRQFRDPGPQQIAFPVIHGSSQSARRDDHWESDMPGSPPHPHPEPPGRVTIPAPFVVASTLQTPLPWERLGAKHAVVGMGGTPREKQHPRADGQPSHSQHRCCPSPSVDKPCPQFPPENPNQCVHPEVPTGALTEPLWQPPPEFRQGGGG